MGISWETVEKLFIKVRKVKSRERFEKKEVTEGRNVGGVTVIETVSALG
jgi:hypothetical protein